MTSEWTRGALVVYTGTGNTGRVMGAEGPYLQLRSPGGGREWDADPVRVRAAADDDEKLRAHLIERSLIA